MALGSCGLETMNLTITVEKEVLRRARIRALEQDTSVNAVLRKFLASYAAIGSSRRKAIDSLLRLSKQASSGRGGNDWTRDELHER